MQRIDLDKMPPETYKNMYNLARLSRAQGWRSNDVEVVRAMKEIIGECPAGDSFDGWTDRKLSVFFYDNFLRGTVQHKASMSKRKKLIRACGVDDSGSKDLLELERRKGLGSFLEERMGSAYKRARTRSYRSVETQTEESSFRSVPEEPDAAMLDEVLENQLSAENTGLELRDENMSLSSTEQHPAELLS